MSLIRHLRNRTIARGKLGQIRDEAERRGSAGAMSFLLRYHERKVSLSDLVGELLIILSHEAVVMQPH